MNKAQEVLHALHSLHEVKAKDLKIGDIVDVDVKVASKGQPPQFIKLLKKALQGAKKGGDAGPIIGSVETNGTVGIRANKFDLLGDVFISIGAIKKVIK